MFLAGAKNLESKKDWINELNVFPVPDGDTGTNMTMTIMSAAKEISAMQDINMHSLAKSMSSGSLRGARGNSGVILSQLLRGFCKIIRDHEELDAPLLCAAFQKASETAYKAVMKPKEGTILTVARGFSDKAMDLIEENPDIALEDLIRESIEYAEDVLAHTPDMLPVLKEAGVVDSGGQGFIQILRGAYDAFMGVDIDYDIPAPEREASEQEQQVSKYSYAESFVMYPSGEFTRANVTELRNYLEMIGDCVSVSMSDGVVSAKVSSDDPGRIISHCTKMGVLREITVDTLIPVQVQEKQPETDADTEKKPHKEVGFIAVSIGSGLGSIFKDLGVDCLIEGGQTMNPSTDDVLHAIDQVDADTIFIFPNNKNIILAASQAQSLAKDKHIIVVPTKTIPQGITALVNYVPENSPEENEKAMYDEIRTVKTVQLTYAVRDTHVDEKEIHEGDYMGVGDKGILAVGTDLQSTALDSVAQMVSDETELISVYYGSDVSAEDAHRLEEALKETYENCDVELNEGDQPIYYYIISAE